MVSIQDEIGTRYKYAEYEAIKREERVAFQYTKLSLLQCQVS